LRSGIVVGDIETQAAQNDFVGVELTELEIPLDADALSDGKLTGGAISTPPKNVLVIDGDTDAPDGRINVELDVGVGVDVVV